MIIDVDNPTWLDKIRISNLVQSGIIRKVRVSSSGKGLHLFTRESYQEPIECEYRAFFRELLGVEFSFSEKWGKLASEWEQPTLDFIFSFDSFQGYGVK